MAKSKPKSNGSSRRGGKRPGSGRKSNPDKKLRDDFNAATNATLTAWLPGLLANLKRLADGGYERVQEKFEADPLVPGKLILVERKVETADADRAANEYLVNRLLGKPMQAVQHSGPEGGPVPVSLVLEVAAAKLYGAPPPNDPD